MLVQKLLEPYKLRKAEPVPVGSSAAEGGSAFLLNSVGFRTRRVLSTDTTVHEVAHAAAFFHFFLLRGNRIWLCVLVMMAVPYEKRQCASPDSHDM